MSEGNNNGKLRLVVIIVVTIVVVLIVFGIKRSQSHSREIQATIIPVFDNASMDTIHPWNDEHISITIPKSMERIISDSARLNFEENYTLESSYNDVFHINMYRLPKSYFEEKGIKNLQSFVSNHQKSTRESGNVEYTADTIKCLADKNGYSCLYYISKEPETWGKTVFITGKDDYYVLNIYTASDYESRYEDFINLIACSFDIDK